MNTRAVALVGEDWHLRALEQRIAQLEAAVDALQRRRAVPDAAADARLCSAIAITFGSSAFSTLDVRTSPSAELCAVLDGMTRRRIGAWLRRLRLRPIAPYALQRIGRDGGGVLWTLHVSDDRHTPTRPARARGAR